MNGDNRRGLPQCLQSYINSVSLSQPSYIVISNENGDSYLVYQLVAEKFFDAGKIQRTKMKDD